MKKEILYVLLLLSGMMSLFTQCKKAEPGSPQVSIKWYEDGKYWRGDTVFLAINMVADRGFDKLIIKSTDIYDSITAFSGTYSATHDFEFVVPFTVLDSAQQTIVTVLTDKGGITVTDTAIISFTEPVCDSIVAYNLSLGSYDSPLGNCFASADGDVYTTASVQNNVAKIAFVYGFGTLTEATLFSPTDSLSGLDTISAYGMNDWGGKRTTFFRKITNNYNWETIMDGCVILYECSLNGLQSYVGELMVGDMVAFTTDSGRKGFIKINSINGIDPAGSISFDMKVIY